MGISRLVFGKMFRFSGTTASAGKVQGAGACSPGLMGVRTSIPESNFTGEKRALSSSLCRICGA